MRLRLSSRTSTGAEYGKNRKMQMQNKTKRSSDGTGERSISGKTQEDQYRQKVEDVFSGQEPIAKISGDVNSEALPVFKSVRDARMT